MVSRLDHYVGRLLAELKRLELDASTLVFFTSDNGPVTAPRTELLRSARHWRGRKGSVYEGGIRVPMIVRRPGRVPAGRVSSEPWSFADVAPTLLELAGLPVPAGLDGRSVLPVLTGTVASLGARPLSGKIPATGCIRRCDWTWKAVRAGLDQPLELYDLVADPTESTDVAAAQPETVATLRGLLDSSHVLPLTGPSADPHEAHPPHVSSACRPRLRRRLADSTASRTVRPKRLHPGARPAAQAPEPALSLDRPASG